MVPLEQAASEESDKEKGKAKEIEQAKVEDEDAAAEGKPAKRPRLEGKAAEEAPAAEDTEMKEADVKVWLHALLDSPCSRTCKHVLLLS